MRKALLALLALAFPLVLGAQTHVLFTLSEFNASPTTNRTVTLQPLTPFKGNLTSYSSSTNGYFYVSNMAAGDYDCVILKRGTANEIAFQITVTSATLGVINAASNTSVRGVQSYPISGKSAWTILASEARYGAASISDGTLTTNKIDTTFRSWVEGQDSDRVANSSGFSTNQTLRGDVVVAATTWSVTGDGNAAFTTLDGGNLLTLGGEGINSWDDVTNHFAFPSNANLASSTNLPYAGLSAAARNQIETNAAYQAYLATNNFTAGTSTAYPTNNETRDWTFRSIVAARTNYTDRLEATNSSTLTLYGGGIEAALESGQFKVRSPYNFSGSGSGLTDIPTNAIDSTFRAWVLDQSSSGISSATATNIVDAKLAALAPLTNGETRSVTLTGSTLTVGGSTGSNMVDIASGLGFVGADGVGFVFDKTNSTITVPGGVSLLGDGTSLTGVSTDTEFSKALTNNETRVVRFTSLVAMPTNYTDRIEATNSSTLTLYGGGVEVALESGAFKVRSPYYYEGIGTGLTNIPGTGIEIGTIPSNRLAFAIGSGGGTGSFTNWINVTDYGATGDDFTDDDSVGIQAAFNAATGLNPYLNKVVYFPPGVYYISNTINITNVQGMLIKGDGMFTTELRAKTNAPILRTWGFWYSRISDMAFYNFGNAYPHTNAVIEIDGDQLNDNTYLGVQGNMFENVYVYAGYGAQGLSINRVGSNHAQGSENLFLNFHVATATNAGVAIYGANALQNTFIGGNVQTCTNYGIYVEAGQVVLMSVGFQNTTKNNYDFYASSGTFSRNTFIGCRSESLRYVYSGGGPVDISGWVGIPAISAWSSNAYSLGDLRIPTGQSYYTNHLAYRCTTAGNSGAAEPTNWATTGTATVTDGGVVWTPVNDEVIRIQYGGELRNSKLPYGKVGVMGNVATIQACTFGRSDWFTGTAGLVNQLGNGIGLNEGSPHGNTLVGPSAFNTNLTVGGSVNATNGFAIGGNSINSFDDVTNFFAMPSSGYSNIVESGYSVTMTNPTVAAANRTWISGDRFAQTNDSQYVSVTNGTIATSGLITSASAVRAKAGTWGLAANDVYLRLEGVYARPYTSPDRLVWTVGSSSNTLTHTFSNAVAAGTVTATNGFSANATAFIIPPTTNGAAGQALISTGNSNTYWGTVSGSGSDVWTNTIPIANSLAFSNATVPTMDDPRLTMIVNNSKIELHNTNILIEATEPNATITFNAASVIMPANIAAAGTSNYVAALHTDVFSPDELDVTTLYATNAVVTGNLNYLTNAATIAPDFLLGAQKWATNDVFTFGLPTNIDPTKFETAIVCVTNSTASAKLITPPAAVKTQGTWYVTNVTIFTFTHWGNDWTNAVALPLY